MFFGGNHLWHLGTSDLVWLFDDLANRPLEDDRRVALSAILSILHAEKTLGNQARSLRRRIAKEPVLIGDLDAFLAGARKAAKRDAASARRKPREKHAKNRAKAMQSGAAFATI